MFFLKCFNKPSKHTHCRFRQSILSKINTFSKKVHCKTDDKNCDTLEHLLRDTDGFLYNSVVESKRMKCGYKQNNKHMVEKLRYEAHIATVLKTVRPLPLSLRYLKESSENRISQLSNEDQNEMIGKEQASEPSKISLYEVNTDQVNSSPKNKVNISEENKIDHKKLIAENIKNWMTHYDNYEYDLVENQNRTITSDLDKFKINYGSSDPNCKVTNYPCGGCGAHLHCKDHTMPGYIPSEIFGNCFSPGGANLGTILCQRCHFLKEYNIALQIRVSPDDYPKVLNNICFKSAFVVLMVDLTDFPCSIWPGIADILGPKTRIIVVGNKVDLLPRDNPKFLKRIKELLYDNVKLCGFADANIRHIDVISAKTGYGVENFITSVLRVWKQKGDVYLIGCTNVGKSTLFNALVQSDFCKIQASDLVQKATTSLWPGTTLNLLKFPITNFSSERLFLRQQRLKKIQKIEFAERKLKEEFLKEHNSTKYATLSGHIGRSLSRHKQAREQQDSFSLQGASNMSGKTKMGIDETDPDFALGKWCFDTPGVIQPDQITDLLTTEELAKTLPTQLIRPETFCVKPGTSLFIAGLARLDYVEGPTSVRLTVFRANNLPITLCKIGESDRYYKNLLGSEFFIVPIDDENRLKKWPGLELAKSFKLSGQSWKESSYDVVLSNAGWIAVNCGPCDYDFQAWTPEKRGVYIRDCLLPEAVKLRGPRIRYSVAYKKNKFI